MTTAAYSRNAISRTSRQFSRRPQRRPWPIAYFTVKKSLTLSCSRVSTTFRSESGFGAEC
jgi:hypothetical protein